MVDISRYETVLRQENYAENTIIAYEFAVRDFLGRYPVVNKANLLSYREYLIDGYSPKTVNIRIRALNKYLECISRPKLALKFVRLPKASFLDNVISNKDYLLLKQRLRNDGCMEWYFLIWFMAATGARVSELVRFRVEHVQAGYIDIISKGGKMRRLYFPKTLQKEALAWLGERRTGILFLNRFGGQITPRGIAAQLKHFADRYDIDPDVMYPHSFRHLFAKNFLERKGDIVLLTDLLGHESVETTRIYLRRTSREQSAIVNRIVDW